MNGARRAGDPHTARKLTLTASSTSSDILDEFALAALADKWTGLFDVGFADGAYRAYRITAGQLLTADTVAGLDSAIRADFYRWITR